MAEESSSVRRVVINGPSFRASLIWWVVKLILPLTMGPMGSPPIPPKGPQVWDLPPKRLRKQIAAGTVEITDWHEEMSGWHEEMSGWHIPILRARSSSSESASSSSPSSAPSNPAPRVVFYFHGGSFSHPLTQVHWEWIAWMSSKLDAEIYVVPYPLAPTNTAFEVMPVLLKIYQSLRERCINQEIIFGGDSAGGFIVLGLAFLAHRSGVPLPNQILAVSAGVNLTMNSHQEEVTKLKRVDPILNPKMTMQARKMWVGQSKDTKDPIPPHVVQDPVYNPSVGDCSIFKEAGTQLVLVSGTYDTMHPYVRDFAESAGRGGAATVYIEGQAQIHDFPLARKFVPESDQAFQAIVDAILEYK